MHAQIQVFHRGLDVGEELTRGSRAGRQLLPLFFRPDDAVEIGEKLLVRRHLPLKKDDFLRDVPSVRRLQIGRRLSRGGG